MKLRPEQLGAHLRRDLLPVYVVSGEEPLQYQESLDAIRARAREQGYDERVVLDVDASFDWSELRQYQDSLSLFATRRIIEIRMPGGKPGREGGAALKDYAQRPAADTVLLVGAGKVERRDLGAAWYKALEGAGASVQVWPVEAARLPRWLRERAAAKGLVLDDEAAAALAERGEGNLLASMQELEKLLLLQGPGPVDLEAVLSAAADSARFSVFDLAAGALGGDRARCVRILRGLREEGAAAPFVSWVLANEIRSAALVAASCEQGLSMDAALRKHRVWRNRAPGLRAALGRLPRERWLALLGEAAGVDRVVKGAPGDPWDALERLALGICGVTLIPPPPTIGP